MPATPGGRRTVPAGAGRHRRAELAALLIGSAVLYLWQSRASGWTNEYYAAAARAGADSWKAFFFGSLDAGSAITVDKPPLGVWPMALSVRLLGPSPFSVLLPQALEGVATVAVVVSLVRHVTSSSRLGLLAGGLFALTPVSVLMFRYDNPDALLILLLVGAAASTVKALDSRRAGAWMACAGALVGLGFLTKMGEALLVVPALTVAYLAYAEVARPQRVLHVVGAGAALLASAGWWVAVVTLWPAGSRPWIGGSTTNSVLGLAFGYNGLGRISGADRAASTGDTWQLSRAGRIFDLQSATASLWLLPAAVVLTAAALRLTSHDPRLRRQRAVLVLWLVWAGTMLGVFAVMTGIFHSYYTIMLAPATAALVTIAGAVVVQHRTRPVARAALVGAALTTGVVAFVLLTGTPGWLPGLRWSVAGTLVVAAGVLHRVRMERTPAARVILAVAVVGVLAPTAFAIATVAASHSGASPVVGPGTSGSRTAGGRTSIAFPQWHFFPEIAGTDLGHETASAEVARLLRDGSDGFRWAAASGGARAASAYELASGAPVIAIGGYQGTDPAPSLSTFEAMVGAGEVHYFFAGWTGGRAVADIESWVSARFECRTVDGTPVYDLTSPIRPRTG